MKLPQVSAALLLAGTLVFGFIAIGNTPASAEEPAPKPASGADGKAEGKADEKPATPTPAAAAEKLTPAQSISRINEIIAAKWKDKNLNPADAATDLEWFRRINLDMLGRAPTLDETEAFMESKSKAKRAETIETMLASQTYADNFSRFWFNALVSNGGQDFRFGDRMLVNWLADSMKANTPYDQMVREILTAEGEADVRNREEASPLGYMILFRNEVSNIAGNVSRAFLGIEIQCVQCHDDKLGERWNQADFNKFAASFVYTRSNRKVNDPRAEGYETYIVNDQPYRKPLAGRLGKAAEDRRKAEEERVKKENPERAMQLALRGAVPTALAQKDPLPGENGLQLRRAMASWITSKDNEWFARTVVNRMWAHYMKRGVADPVDDFSSTNPPSNPELLAFLAKDFVANGYDLKRLARVIVGTKAYQLSSAVSSKSSKDDRIWYSRSYIEQLSGEQLFDSLISVTGMGRAAAKAGDGRGLERIREALLRGFKFVFDDDEGKQKESFTGTVPQALLMMNGDFVDRAIGSTTPGSTLYNILKTTNKVPERVRLMYLAVLTREPEARELQRMTLSIVDDGKGTLAAYEDVFWALLNSAEFLNNH